MSCEPLSVVQIGARRIGPGEPAYIIAEAGVNHNGSVDTALKMVDAARQAHADAVKFQVFGATRLASRFADLADYQKACSALPSQVEMLSRLELRREDFARIKQHCDEAGIEFLATPFGVEDLQLLLDLGVRAIKISSPDIINRPLLEGAGQSGLPVLLSTGASEQGEIDRACELLEKQYGTALVLLHCVSNYPVKLEQANLRRIASLRGRYNCPVGFSDHTLERFTGQLAVAGGADLLEKHFTLDKSQTGPDHAFSQTPGHLADYVRHVRRGESALGSGTIDAGPAEQEIRQLSRCSVTAGRDISAGAVIGRDMLAVKRPGSGISPWEIESVVGRVAKSDIGADTPITWEMLSNGG